MVFQGEDLVTDSTIVVCIEREVWGCFELSTFYMGHDGSYLWSLVNIVLARSDRFPDRHPAFRDIIVTVLYKYPIFFLFSRHSP